MAFDSFRVIEFHEDFFPCTLAIGIAEKVVGQRGAENVVMNVVFVGRTVAHQLNILAVAALGIDSVLDNPNLQPRIDIGSGNRGMNDNVDRLSVGASRLKILQKDRRRLLHFGLHGCGVLLRVVDGFATVDFHAGLRLNSPMVEIFVASFGAEVAQKRRAHVGTLVGKRTAVDGDRNDVVLAERILQIKDDVARRRTIHASLPREILDEHGTVHIAWRHVDEAFRFVDVGTG